MSFKITPLNDRLITSVMLALIAALIAYSGELVRFDNLYYDLGRHLSFKAPPSDILIVAIDEPSLKQIGHWPWSKSTHAQLIDKLHNEQAKVIGLDIVLPEPEQNNPAADNALEQSIRQAGNVVLPIVLDMPFTGAPVNQILPLENLANAAASLGRTHVPLDGDGIARGIYMWKGVGRANLPLFAQSVLQVAHELPENTAITPPIAADEHGTPKVMAEAQLSKYDPRKINFIGPPGTFQRISYARVLEGDYPIGFFKNKIVLVGATAAALGDLLPTPVSAYTQPMTGIEFQANIIEAMRSSKLIMETPLWFSCLFCALLAIIPLLWLPRLSPLKSLLMITVYYFVVIGIVISMPRYLNIWVPPAGALVAILLAYPIWSWRKLESAHTYLDIELQNLRNDLAMLGVGQTDSQAIAAQDPLQARISKVRLAAEHLRGLHRRRSDTLAFISHDLRAPLGTAMMLLEEFESNKYSERIAHMLKRAHTMAENFLQASRAEMANVHKFQELDVVSLVQQIVDEAYEKAQAKQVKINMFISASMLWVKADFGLMSRALENILLNAVRYSPENAEVKVEISANNDEIMLQISDAGPGIPPERISRLFKRFSRAEGEQQAAEGTGLGLYFVEVTVNKHGGTVALTSIPGVKTTFIITLPRIAVPVDVL